jgi:hypothetical protein
VYGTLTPFPAAPGNDTTLVEAIESASTASRRGTKRKAGGDTPVKGKRPLSYKVWSLSSFKEPTAAQKSVLQSIFPESPWLLLEKDSSQVVCIPSLLVVLLPLILTHHFSSQPPTADVFKITEQLRNAGLQVVCVTDIPYGTTKDLCDPVWDDIQMSNFVARIAQFVGRSGAGYVFCSETQATLLSEIYRGLLKQIPKWTNLGYLLNYVSLPVFLFLLSITCN